MGDVVEFLNEMLAEQKADPLNVVVVPEVVNVKVPSMRLHNVTATDVLNVVTKVTGLSLEPVPSDSGKVAAWIVSRRMAGGGMGGAGFATFAGTAGGGGELGGGGGTRSGGGADGSDPEPVPVAHPVAEPTLSGIPIPTGTAPGSLTRGTAGNPNLPGAPGSSGAPSRLPLVDPTDPMLAPAQISRVLGIGKIYGEVLDEDKRAGLEADLTRRLQAMAEEQHMACTVRPYHELHIIVVKGAPEAVALVEQAVTAMKENAGVRMPTGVVAPIGR